MLAVVTCFHGRPKVTELYLNHTLGMGLPVFAAITRGDQENISLCRRKGVWFTETDNFPLGKKHNVALELAYGYYNLGTVGWDGILMLPSDDLVSQEWVDTAESYIKQGVDYLIPEKCGIYDTVTGQAHLLRQSPEAKSLLFGAGIVISKRALDKVRPLWSETRSGLLDTTNHFKLQKAGIKPHYAVSQKPHVTDIKTRENFSKVRSSTPIVREEDVLWMLSEETRQGVLSIR